MTARLPPPKNSSAIQTTQPPTVAVYQPRRARGFISNVLALLLQPGYFFRTFPTNTQWVVVAIVVLLLAGFLAVRQPTDSSGDAAAPIDAGPVFDPSMMGSDSSGGGGVIDGGISVGPPAGFDSQNIDGGAPTSGASSDEVRSTTTTALLGAGDFVLMWVLQAVLLCLVPLLRGRSASLGRNLQVAVWAAIPLGLMIGARLIYYESGGSTGTMGLSALIDHWEGFTTFSPFVQNVLFSLLSSLTLFWLWNVILIYIGGRFALNGRAWAAFLVTLMWVIIAVLIPVATGSVIAPTVQAAEDAANAALMESTVPDGGDQGMILNGTEGFQEMPDGADTTIEPNAEDAPQDATATPVNP
ncbi:MAG: YIP1 family protein [Anaerolineae bacterium]